MKRYVDLDEILLALPKSAEKIIRDWPAVEIVHCKDCKYADKYNHCSWVNWWANENDFCSHGQPKDNRPIVKIFSLENDEEGYFTEEEKRIYREAIEKQSQPTGININDLF